MNSLHAEIQDISSQEELARFVEKLASAYFNPNESWANKDLPSFLEALSGWIEDMDGYYKNNNINYDENNILWRNVADMLYAATMYEQMANRSVINTFIDAELADLLIKNYGGTNV